MASFAKARLHLGWAAGMPELNLALLNGTKWHYFLTLTSNPLTHSGASLLQNTILAHQLNPAQITAPVYHVEKLVKLHAILNFPGNIPELLFSPLVIVVMLH
jgi:hypothetical protein